MSKVHKIRPAARDDTRTRVLALATQARKELGLPADRIDWERLYDNVRQMYERGIREQSVDWKEVIGECLVQKKPDLGRVEKRLWWRLAAFDKPIVAFAQLAALIIIAALSLFLLNAYQTGSALRAELDALRSANQSSEALRDRLEIELQQERAANEQREQVSKLERDQLQQQISELQRERISLKEVIARSLSEPKGPITIQDISGTVTIGKGVVMLPDGHQLDPTLSGPAIQLATKGEAQPGEITDQAIASQRSDLKSERSRGDRDGPGLISPLFTAVRSTTPTLKWNEVAEAHEYKVRIAEVKPKKEAKVLLERTTTGSEFVPPSNLLRPGGVYSWEAEARKDGLGRVSRRGRFWVLNEPALHEIESAEQRYGGSALVLAGLYEKHGLYDDALSKINILREENNGNLVERMHEKLLKRLKKIKTVPVTGKK